MSRPVALTTGSLWGWDLVEWAEAELEQLGEDADPAEVEELEALIRKGTHQARDAEEAA